MLASFESFRNVVETVYKKSARIADVAEKAYSTTQKLIKVKAGRALRNGGRIIYVGCSASGPFGLLVWMFNLSS